MRRARAATLLMLALPGSAYLYQGEELGLHEVGDIPEAVRQDPAFFRSRAWRGRDGCRVPLPWRLPAPPSGSATAEPTCPSRTGSQGRGGGAGRTEGSTLELYRRGPGPAPGAAGRRIAGLGRDREPGVLHFSRPGGWQSVTNFGDTAVALPGGTVLVSSAILEDGKLPANTTAWLR